MMLVSFAVVLAAYLLGSISFAVVASRLFGLPDPHTYGSQNPGATNVLRTGNKKAAALTVIGDTAKSFVAVLLVERLARAVDLAEWTLPAAAITVFLGHLYPVFHRFAGGKGVATAAGIVFALSWPLGLMLLALWLIIIYTTKLSSLAALTVATLMPAGMFYVFGARPIAWAMLPIGMLLFWRHRDNIGRLIHGRERRIGH